MMMTNYTSPDFEAEFQALGPIWPTLWDAAEYACEVTRYYFLDVLEVKKVDPSLAPEIQRYHAKRRLHEKGIKNAEFIMQDLGRNGIAFGFRQRCIRVWKRGHELIPRAGNSRAKLSFFGQQPYLPFADFAQVAQPNRFILYETDSEFRLQWLWYALPIGAALDGPTDVHWIEKVTFDRIADLGIEPIEPTDLTPTEGDNLPLTQRPEDEHEQDGEEGKQETES